MTLPKIFLVVSVAIFSSIGFLALNKKQKAKNPVASTKVFEGKPIEIDLKKIATPAAVQPTVKKEAPKHVEVVADVDRLDLLFQENSPLPFIQTVRYKSHVTWKSGRPAWLVDYASHYQTSLDFISRSLNGKANYVPPQVAEGRQFNVLRTDKDFSFHLVVSLSSCRLWLYAIDPENETSYLLKSCPVGLGRLDTQKASGCLTPLGKYKLGTRTAVFKPKMMGMHRNNRVELMQVFGTRWIPFDREIENCSEPAKGFGLHGTPWAEDSAKNHLVDNETGLSAYESDGCIRLRTADNEAIFAVISTRPGTIEIVRNFSDVKLPFREQG